MKSQTEPEEIQKLIRRSLGGDLAAFRMLMESQQQYAYAVAFPLLRNEENAKDVVQEAFVRVWKNLGKYRHEVKFTTWLYKIVINLCYDRIKMDSRRKNIFGYASDLAGSSDAAVSGTPYDEAEKTDLCRHALAEAKNLPPKERLVFSLRDVQDFSIEEIAECTGISIASVKANLCYARKKIRIALNRLQESEQR